MAADWGSPAPTSLLSAAARWWLRAICSVTSLSGSTVCWTRCRHTCQAARVVAGTGAAAEAAGCDCRGSGCRCWSPSIGDRDHLRDVDRDTSCDTKSSEHRGFRRVVGWAPWLFVLVVAQ